MKTRDIYYGELPEIRLFSQKYSSFLDGLEEVPFRCCKATVGKIGKYTYLRSYDTVVAFINNITGEGYDILRTEYGYTATSAQHIRKFFADNFVVQIYRTDYKDGCCITKVLY